MEPQVRKVPLFLIEKGIELGLLGAEEKAFRIAKTLIEKKQL